MTPEDVAWMPHLNVTLNATATVLLVVGRRQIARRDEAAHRRTMLAACAASAAFLTSYLVYHSVALHREYPGEGALRALYLFVLGSHILLVVPLVWMVPRTVWLGLKERRDAHRRLARWTYPLWLYVSATGVIVYLMLYPFAPGPGGP